jgi:hypothetical protein
MDIYRFRIQNLNNGILKNTNAMPMKDSTSDNTSTFAMSRFNYISSFTAQSSKQNPQKKWIGGNRDASQTVEKRRIGAIGLGSMNAVNTPNSYVSNSSKNTVNDALRRVRGGGAVAPPKKASSPSIHMTPHFTPAVNKNVYGLKNPYLYH